MAALTNKMYQLFKTIPTSFIILLLNQSLTTLHLLFFVFSGVDARLSSSSQEYKLLLDILVIKTIRQNYKRKMKCFQKTISNTNIALQVSPTLLSPTVYQPYQVTKTVE